MDARERAQRYCRLKYGIALIQAAYLMLLLMLFATSGMSGMLASYVSTFPGRPYLTVALYLAVSYIAYGMFSFPFALYQSYALEHSFGLSRQKWLGWFTDQLKAALLVYFISCIFFAVFYRILAEHPSSWWAIVSFIWVLMSAAIARFTPQVVIPLFFKYTPLADQELTQRIMRLAERMKVKIIGVFEIDLSKKTTKANAAFVGMGSTKRILLADTLKNRYSHDEIEVILAHEFSHYRMKHLVKLLALKSAGIVFIFWLIAVTGPSLVQYCEALSLANLATFPLVMLYFLVIGALIEPFEHYVSRRMERHADSAALKTTGLKDAFISMMEKLGDQNLADRAPSPLVKFFFFDHPPIDERIAFARALP